MEGICAGIVRSWFGNFCECSVCYFDDDDDDNDDDHDDDYDDDDDCRRGLRTLVIGKRVFTEEEFAPLYDALLVCYAQLA